MWANPAMQTNRVHNFLALGARATGGQTKVPLVVREPMGMWRSSAAQHSQSLEVLSDSRF